MHDESIMKILAGFKNFREKFFKQQDFYQELRVSGQSPQTLVITCSDSRVDPSILFETNPGDIFVVRNVANLVPPFEQGGGYHGVSAAIEFAVQNLKVKNILVIGHRQCGGIRSLMDTSNSDSNSFVSQWMKIAEGAKNRVLKSHANLDFETQCVHCEKEAIVSSIENLRSFPFISEKESSYQLQILGLYFDLELGHLQMYFEETKKFDRIS